MKIAIIGYGSIGKRHERVLKEWFGIEPIIVERGAPAPRQNVDMAVICTPTASHVPIALEWSRRDVALFIEKPLSNSLEGLDELQHEIETRKLPFYVGYPLRYYSEASELIRNYATDAGFIPKIVPIKMTCFSDATKWPSKRPIDNVLLELSHEIDLGIECFGRLLNLHGTLFNEHVFVGSGDYFQGTVDFLLSTSAKYERRELTISANKVSIEVDDELFAKQWEEVFRDMHHDRMYRFVRERNTLEKILEFINGSR